MVSNKETLGDVMDFEIRRLSYGIGAEIAGLNLSVPLAPETIQALRQAWLDHNVLLFREQRITPRDHIRFSEYWGDVEEYPLKHYQHPDYPQIFLLSNEPRDGKVSQTRNAGRHWHSDLSFTTKPAIGSILHCQRIPDVGGTTLFANQYMAYDRLSPTFRSMIEQLKAVHELFSKTKDIRSLNQEQLADMRRKNPRVTHPVVRIHPETNRPALYVSEALTSEILGMTPEESAPLLDFLFRHCIMPEFTYRHQWRPYDILMWDNRCTLHMAVPDNDHVQARLMHRTTLTGPTCGELLGDDGAAVQQPSAQQMAMATS